MKNITADSMCKHNIVNAIVIGLLGSLLITFYTVVISIRRQLNYIVSVERRDFFFKLNPVKHALFTIT